jgi:hypothetical protein
MSKVLEICLTLLLHVCSIAWWGGGGVPKKCKNNSPFFSPSQLKKFQEIFHFHCLSEKNGKKYFVNKMPKW